MNERRFQTMFTRWASHNLKKSTATELKIVKGNRFYKKALPPHQERNLLNVKNGGIYYKIPDVGLAPKPFDGFYLVGDAYVVLMFYKPRKEKKFYAIDIDAFIRMPSPSFTEEEAGEIASFEGLLL